MCCQKQKARTMAGFCLCLDTTELQLAASGNVNEVHVTRANQMQATGVAYMTASFNTLEAVKRSFLEALI